MNRPAGEAHAVETTVARAVGLPAAQAAEVDLSVLWIAAPAHEAGLEFQREADHASLGDAIHLLGHHMEEGPASITHEEDLLFERTPLVAGDPDLAAAGVVHVHRQPTDRLVVTGGNGRRAIEGRDFECGPGLRIAGIDGE